MRSGGGTVVIYDVRCRDCDRQVDVFTPVWKDLVDKEAHLDPG